MESNSRASLKTLPSYLQILFLEKKEKIDEE